MEKIGSNVENYKNFPRIVGETGGKDFIFVHNSADVDEIVANIIRGAFESQGQKCSAVSRVYIPRSNWDKIKKKMIEELQKVRYGNIDDFNNFMGAVISEEAFKKYYIEYAKNSDEYEIIYGGNYDDSKEWFVEPTVIISKNADGGLMKEEFFGPVVTIYIYEDEKYEEMLNLCDASTSYGLTGAIFAKDREAIQKAEKILRYAAGNFYINDKPTGAIVARQPFGGARYSGTNDKAGSWLNLLRWMNPRVIKETTLPAKEWKRAFMK